MRPLCRVIDRFFGTLYLPKDEQPAHYGIDEPLPANFLGQLLEPFLISRAGGPRHQRPGIPLLSDPLEFRGLPPRHRASTDSSRIVARDV
jgi:hypothetical protein